MFPTDLLKIQHCKNQLHPSMKCISLQILYLY